VPLKERIEKMTHKLTVIEDDILGSKFIGDVDEEVLAEFKKNITPFLETATDTNPLHFLVDASQEGRFSGAARRAFAQMFINDQRLGRVGIINAARFTQVMATFLMKATRRTETTRFFDDEVAALAWLRG